MIYCENNKYSLLILIIILAEVICLIKIDERDYIYNILICDGFKYIINNSLGT